MFKRVAEVMGSLFASGCASLMNSGRPKYLGPVVAPVWHNSDVRVAEAPIIQDGVVYVNARPWTEANRHLFAFDLKTGKQLCVTSFSPERLLLAAGNTVFVADAGGSARAFDAKTGQETAAFAVPGSFESGIFADGVLYILGKGGEVRAMDGSGHTLWRATVPVTSLSPPIAAGGNPLCAWLSACRRADSGPERSVCI
jgi:outer membrane protein assembly factor BamB